MKLSELLADQPPVRSIADARKISRQKLISSGRRLAIIDDDPTGPQAVQDVPVYMDWSVETLRRAFRAGNPVFFINTNSRSLNRDKVIRVSLEAGRNLHKAAGLENAGILITSRSDSTLRGHFPAEVEALITGLEFSPDGIILAPAFFEGGRYTVGDIHYAELNGEMVPVHLTEFARDPAFSYKNSDLKSWVEEKTGGAVQAGNVLSITFEMIRNGGPEAVARELMKASDGRPVIVNAACYEDLDILALGIADAEERGKSFFYRCSASFIKARGGFEDKPLLTRRELTPGAGPGLVVAGSYVEKTSRQLKKLLDSGMAEGIELRVERLQKSREADVEINLVSDYVNDALSMGRTAAVFTSREMKPEPEEKFRETGRITMNSLCRVVKNIDRKPGFVIAKGGITSIELARTALEAREAFAIGQILGGVPVWRLSGEARWTDIPFVVFPGNVGDENALLKAVEILTGH